MAFFQWIWNTAVWLVKLVLPIFAKARDFRGISPAVRWTLHIVLVLAVLIGLGAVNRRYKDLQANLGDAPEWLKLNWLPLLALVIYALLFLAWCLWKLLGAEGPESEYREIDQAWDEATAALDRAGIDLRDCPLFLVLGHSEGGEDALFAGAGFTPIVNGAPERGDSPLHVYADREAIYVTCAGASVLGRQAAILAGTGGDSASGNEGPSAVDEGKTLMPGADDKSLANPLKDIQDIIARAEREGRKLEDLVDEDRKRLAIAKRRSNPRPPLDVKVAEEFSGALRHLCRLIVRDRSPYCPANGILVLLPFASSDSERDADQTASAAQRDVANARAAFQLHLPVFVLVADVETAKGFREFVLRLPAAHRRQGLGQRFPLVPDLDPDAIAEKVDESVRFIFHGLLPYWIFSRFRIEEPGQADGANLLRGNAELYQLLSELRVREARFGRIVSRAVVPEDGSPPLYGGTYIAGTGIDPTEQAFVRRVFDRLNESQSYVSWSDSALQEEAYYDRAARYGYVAISFLAVAVIGGLALAVIHRLRQGSPA